MSTANQKTIDRTRQRVSLAFNEEDERWVARFPEIPGLVCDGATPEEALEQAQSALSDREAIAEEVGEELPAYRGDDTSSFSGKFLARIPIYLHEQLAERAEVNGVSLNQYVVTALTRQLSEDSFVDVATTRLAPVLRVGLNQSQTAFALNKELFHLFLDPRLADDAIDAQNARKIGFFTARVGRSGPPKLAHLPSGTFVREKGAVG